MFPRTVFLLFLLLPWAMASHSARADALTSSALAHYSLNESSASDSVLADSAGGHPALLLGNEEPLPTADAATTGVLGGAIRLNGEDQVIRLRDSEGLHFGRAFSISFWCRMGDPGDSATLLSKNDFARGERGWYVVWRGDLGQWRLGVGQGEDIHTRYHFPATLEAGRFHHIAAVYDGKAPPGARWTLFVDGAEVEPVEAASDAGWAPSANAAPILLGAGLSEGFLVNYFAGSFDEVWLFDRALDAAEVRELYGRGRIAAGPARGERTGDQTLRPGSR